MTETIITIAGQQYLTTKEYIKALFKKEGFNVFFKPESIKGQFRSGYFTVVVTHNFNCFADKLRASRKIKLALDDLNKI